MTSIDLTTSNLQTSPFFRLPAELRLEILSYLFTQRPNTGFKLYESPLLPPTGLYIDDSYTPSSQLSILLTCKQFRADFTELAFKSTHFILTSTFTPVPTQLSKLQPFQVGCLKYLNIVVGRRQFQEMVHWERFPFNAATLRLERLSVVFHRSGYWHYPSDHTSDLVSLLRRLTNIQRLKFIRNGAHIKGYFKTWFNRLVGLILKEDHRWRYDVVPVPGAGRAHPSLPAHWWDWEFDDEEQSFELVAKEPMAIVKEEVYMETVKPFVEELMRNMEMEEEDPDPRSRNAYP